VVGRQNADIADTLQLRDVPIAITFWLTMGSNFSCMIAIATRCLILGWVFGNKLSNEDRAKIKGVRDVAMKTNFGTKLAAYNHIIYRPYSAQHINTMLSN